MSRKDRDRGPVRFMFLLERSLAKRIQSYTRQEKKKQFIYKNKNNIKKGWGKKEHV